MKQSSPYYLRPVDESDHGMVQDGRYEDPRLAALTPATVDLSYYWSCLRKHFRLVLAVPLSLIVLVWLRDVMATPQYTAQAVILIKGTAPKIFSGTSIEGSTDNQDQSSEIVDRTQYELMKSWTLAAKVIAAEDLQHNPIFAGTPAAGGQRGNRSSSPLGWLRSFFPHANGTTAMSNHTSEPLTVDLNDPEAPPVPPGLLYAYLGALTVKPIEESELVRVSFTTSDPALSAKLANAHVREFIHQGIDLNSQTSEEAERFLKGKLEDLRGQVERSELALNNYRRDKGIIPGLISVNGKEDVILERLNRLSDELEDAHLKSLALGAQVDMINQGHTDALPQVIGDSVIQTLKSKLGADEAGYAGMQGKYTADYPPMAELQASMRGTRDAMAREERSTADSVKDQYLSELKKENDLADEFKRQKDFALGLNDAAVRYAILERDAQTSRELYNSVLKRMKDVEVTADVHTSNVSIVDRALPPLGPSSPRKGRDLLAALVFGLMGGIGAAFLMDYLDHTLKTSDEVRAYLGLPALSVIPDFARIPPSAYQSRKLPTEQPPSPATTARDGEIVVSLGVNSAAGEAYRTLRTALQLSRPGSPPRSILITSAVSKEGKTATAANTAIMLAMTGKSVLLIDADLRKPTCHTVLSVENHSGLSEVLTGVGPLNELIRATRVAQLSFLSSGTLPPNPAELLGSEKMREVLEELEGQYSYVVIDSAPVLPVSDAVLLSSLVEGVVLVIGNSVAKQQVREAVSRLDYARARILGAVLNKVDITRFHYHYHDYYHDYYSQEENAESA